jgi:poly-beta-1,6-N-acetyl-D-glucosamine synthase
VNVTALIPAHNEAEWIEQVVINLKDQTRPPSRIIVVSDNSTDATISLAAAAGAEVQVSVDNTHKKAGALNQALGRILPDLDDTDFIFIQDHQRALRQPTYRLEHAPDHPGERVRP